MRAWRRLAAFCCVLSRWVRPPALRRRSYQITAFTAATMALFGGAAVAGVQAITGNSMALAGGAPLAGRGDDRRRDQPYGRARCSGS